MLPGFGWCTCTCALIVFTMGDPWAGFVTVAWPEPVQVPSGIEPAGLPQAVGVVLTESQNVPHHFTVPPEYVFEYARCGAELSGSKEAPLTAQLRVRLFAFAGFASTDTALLTPPSASEVAT